MAEIQRLRFAIEGVVQGVGFRPFVYRLAIVNRLGGWVQNTPTGILLEVEGETASLQRFRSALEEETPPLAVITSISCASILAEGDMTFVIRPSSGGEARALVAPDGDVCTDCLIELFNPADRRYLYPFINCTNCGPRYSIITGIPYDRPATTMAPFQLCPVCQAEYDDPLNRRFHAQPNACSECGPQLVLLDPAGELLPGEPLTEAIRLLKEGGIIAVKGTGGYHLAVDACNEKAVAELRSRKKRDEKPFAIMVADLAAVDQFALADKTERRLLNSAERPIVILKKRGGDEIAPSVSPANDYFGIMLPTTPLQYLLLRGNFPVLVMTSGNLSDEPVAYRDDEARQRLADIADAFLSHNREIHCHSDDSVLRVFQHGPLVLRRARGYVPRVIAIPALSRKVLAVGAELKGTICLTRGSQAFLSQHLGDLKNSLTMNVLAETVSHLSSVLQIEPELVAHDLHPDYLSTGYAEAFAGGLPRLAVQHHHAHMASCMAENSLSGETIGVIFDGAGYGPDATVWGGEFLLGNYGSFIRAGHIFQVPLPGGDAAAREPYRMALAWLHSVYGDWLFSHRLSCCAEVAEADQPLFLQMLESGLNSPSTSSCGRLFDAVASLLDCRQRITYEGQAAMELESLAESAGPSGSYPYMVKSSAEGSQLDFRLTIEAIIEDIAAGEDKKSMARRFHTTIAVASADVCDKIRRAKGVSQVVLSGGVFQNRLLSEELQEILTQRGFQVYTHRLVPPNDGGIALGQAVIAGHSAVPYA